MSRKMRRMKPDEPDLTVVVGFVMRLEEGPTGQCRMYLDSEGNEALVAIIREHEADFHPVFTMLERTVCRMLGGERTEPEPLVVSSKVARA